MNRSNPFIFTLLLTFSLILGLSIVFVPNINSQSDKISICHRTEALQNPWVAIRVSSNSLPSHLEHGDFYYTGPTDADGDFSKNEATSWCISNVPGTQPPPVSPLEVSSECQADSINGLIKIENPTADTLYYKIYVQGSNTFVYENFINPSIDGLSTFVYHILPVNQLYTIETYIGYLDEAGNFIKEIIAVNNSLIIPSSPTCTFLTYCYDGVTYQLVDYTSTMVNFPPEGYTDGACIN